MVRKFFVLSLVFCVLSSQLFAFAFMPGKKTPEETPVTVEIKEVSQPAVEVSEPSPAPSLDEVIAQLENSKKIQKSKEDAQAVAELKQAYEDLKVVNQLALDNLDAAEKELDKVHLSIGLGLFVQPNVWKDDMDRFGTHGIVGLRKGPWMVQGFAGFYDLCNEDPCKETLYGGINVAYEF